MKNAIKSVIALTVICAVLAVILAVTNSITAPIIEKNEKEAANRALLEVMPEGEDFHEVDVSSLELPVAIKSAQKETSKGGYVITVVTTGYGSGLEIMIGVGADGTVTGTKCLNSSETLGKEKTYGENFVGKDAEGVESVDTIATATLTTAAYKDAVKYAIEASVMLEGEAK